MMKAKLATLVLLLFTLVLPGLAANIAGVVADAQTGDPIIGANVVLRGTSRGASTDLDGNYVIRGVEEGSYTILVTSLGYTEQEEPVSVYAMGEVKVNFALLSSTVKLEDVVVTGKRAETGSSERELMDRMEASNITDAVAGEEMSRMPDPDVADVVRRATGVSTQGGNPIIRGLDKRYSKVSLNSAQISGTEPNSSGVSLDLFPTSMMSRVTISKSYTVDQMGEYAGGVINMNTWEALGKKEISAGASMSVNQATFKKDFLSYPGGGRDWLGFDDGTRALPDLIESATPPIIEGGLFTPGGYTSQKLKAFGRSFENNWARKEIYSLPNQSYSLSLSGDGDTFGKDFSYLVTGMYKNGYTFRETETATYRLQLGEPRNFYNEKSYQHKVSVGSMGSLNYRLSPTSRIGLNYMYNHEMDDETRTMLGYDTDHATWHKNTRYRTIYRTVFSTQLSGNVALPSLLNSNVEASYTHSRGYRNEPDLREIFYGNGQDDYSPDDLFKFDMDDNSSGTRAFTDQNDFTHNANIDWAMRPWGLRRDFVFKFGGAVLWRERDFLSRYFFVEEKNPAGDLPFSDEFMASPPEVLFAPENFSETGFQVIERRGNNDSYDASRDIKAGYGMIETAITEKTRLNAGVRLEHFNQDVASYYVGSDSAMFPGLIDVVDVLPALNFTYSPTAMSNVRIAASRTTSRPDFREMSSYFFFDKARGGVVGNSALDRALVWNLDTRFERMQGSSNLQAVSVFYKHFDDPIEEMTVMGSEVSYSWANVDQAYNYGIEFELRQQLGDLHWMLDPFFLSTNLSLIWSEVKGDSVLFRDQSGEQYIKTTLDRPLQGQSPYLFNLMLGYENPKYKTVASVYFNVFGKRIEKVGAGVSNTEGTVNYMPNVYEMPHPDLDFTVQQPLGETLKLKLSVENILDSEYRFEQDDHPTEVYKLGRAYAVGLSFKM